MALGTSAEGHDRNLKHTDPGSGPEQIGAEGPTCSPGARQELETYYIMKPHNEGHMRQGQGARDQQKMQKSFDTKCALPIFGGLFVSVLRQ
jgi:hypothetical protein